MGIGAIGSSSYDGRGDLYAASTARLRQNRSSSDVNAPQAGFGRSNEQPELRVGFGKDSVSVPGVAANTLRRNLNEAKKAVPSIEENEARVRDQLASEQRKASTEEFSARRQTIRFSAGQQEAAAQAGKYISSLNSAASDALTRLGQGAAQPNNGASVNVGDSEFPIGKSQPTRRPLDLLA